MSENPTPENTLVYLAYAKINLCLEITGKRPDGFHNLASVMQTISLADKLHLKPCADLEFDCNLPELVAEDNLVWRAACRLQDLLPGETKPGASLYLEKEIPVASGMGGGSSDGATALMALNTFWQVGLTHEQLIAEAAQLGSDVPFFIEGGTALAEGRGEILTPLPALPKSWIVLVYPELDLPPNKTAMLYKSLSRSDYSGGQITRQLVNVIRTGEPISQSLLYNSFEHTVYEHFPILDSYRNAMVSAGLDYVRISGSGPTLYSLVDSEDTGRRIVSTLEQSGYLTFLAETING